MGEDVIEPERGMIKHGLHAATLRQALQSNWIRVHNRHAVWLVVFRRSRKELSLWNQGKRGLQNLLIRSTHETVCEDRHRVTNDSDVLSQVFEFN